jgi:hypothetical protein
LPIDESALDRKDEGAVGPAIRSVAVSQYGMTVGQSVSDGFVVATTFKLLRGGQIHVQPASGGLSAADALDVSVSTKFDMDVGIMAALGPLRVGGILRNVTRPEFGGDGGDFRLDRKARVGAALVRDRLPVPVNLAVDVDLNETETLMGEVRHTAAGVEAYVWERRVGVRGGVSVNTAGAGGTSASGGLSVMLQSGLYAEGAITRGSDPSREGWSLGLNVTF